MSKSSVHVVIVGTGLGGISAAIALKKYGFTNFTIYEQASTVGGTWRDNTYPGCASDAVAHWYSHSEELNPYWDTPYATRSELHAYWVNVFHKYSLEQHTRFNTIVDSAVWHTETQRYHIVLTNTVTGGTTESATEVLVWAIGGFKGPHYPVDLPGRDKFRGISWHSAEWNHDADLRGKRVGVIGNGCSAAQFIPEISKDPSVEVVNFCRTPQWYIERINTPFSSFQKWTFANVPFVLRWYRNWLWFRADASSLFVFSMKSSFLSGVRQFFLNYIRHNAPKHELDNLTPNYPPGCKRIIVDPGYLASLHRPNVSLKWDGIDEIVEDGIKLRSGEVVPLDIIIYGTGYTTEATNLHVQGNNGITLQEYSESKGGGHAHLGCSFPGFPNMFMILGPNVATGHASIVFSEEVQINLMMDCVKPVIEGKIKSMEISGAATDKYNAWLQDGLGKTVWSQCSSYYHRINNKQVKNVATFPGPVALLWWKAKTHSFGDYKVVGGAAWLRERKLRRWRQWASFVLCLGVVLSWYSPSLARLLSGTVSGYCIRMLTALGQHVYY